MPAPQALLERRNEAYQWIGPESTLVADSVLDLGGLGLPAGEPSGEAAWIQDNLVKALRTFEATGSDLAWWTLVPVNWPADADYYSWGQVHITEAHQWDVVGHEFGHAMFHIGSSSRSAGGQHYIDRCYSKPLAWSEGWASYFAAVTQLERGDPDARFEFMVPRRAPIRLENVPEDVCASERNEWRVAAALWDLYDSHEDGTDRVAIDFARMWAWMRAGRSMGSLSDYWALLRARLGAEEADAVFAALSQSRVDLER